uniref:Uncharacterized protein n=1 Tax=Cuerna arida TaxID=1464854 RepID=A0A1B6GP36_9HEMI
MFPALLGKYTSALGVIAAAVPLYYFVRKYLNTDSDDYDDIWPKNEVLFFCDVGLSCKDHSLEGGEKKQCSSKNCSFYNLRFASEIFPEVDQIDASQVCHN